MATIVAQRITTFFDLKAWQEAHSLTLAVYKITKAFPSQEQFGIISQLRRAVSSIGANIAEGFGRFHYKDRGKFYYQARGSCAEVQNFLALSRDLTYISREEYQRLFQLSENVAQLINGLIRATEKLAKQK